jgi:hypothetical protein
MADEQEGQKSFRVTPEECRRWADRLNKMAKSLEKKDGDFEDQIKMYYTASVLVQRLEYEIRQDSMFQAVADPFGTKTVGEC